MFVRNVLDDLRLSLESLLRAILNNKKSLENQQPTLGAFVKGRGGSSELSNMFLKLVEYYCKYQNTYVKHDDAVIEEEVEFVIEACQEAGVDWKRLSLDMMLHVVEERFTPAVLEAGFRNTKIWPWDKNAFMNVVSRSLDYPLVQPLMQCKLTSSTLRRECA